MVRRKVIIRFRSPWNEKRETIINFYDKSAVRYTKVNGNSIDSIKVMSIEEAERIIRNINRTGRAEIKVVHFNHDEALSAMIEEKINLLKNGHRVSL